MLTSIGGLLFAAGGAVLLDRWRLPAGPLVGALSGVLVAMALGLAVPTANVTSISAVSIAVGILLAVRVNRLVAQRLTDMLVPAAATALLMVAAGGTYAYVLTSFFGWAPSTAAFSTYPGGLEQMVTIAGSLGGDVYSVTVVHLFRWFAVVLFYPLVLRRAFLTRDVRNDTANASGSGAWSNVDVLAVAAGIAGGALAIALSIPAGGILGSFLGAAGVRAYLAQASPAIHPAVSKPLLALVGYVMASGVEPGAFAATDGILLAAASVTAALIVAGFASGLLLHLLTRWKLALCIIATAPAGLIEMTLLSDELGLNSEVVFSLHFTRMLSVVVLAPVLFRVLW